MEHVRSGKAPPLPTLPSACRGGEDISPAPSDRARTEVKKRASFTDPRMRSFKRNDADLSLLRVNRSEEYKTGFCGSREVPSPEGSSRQGANLPLLPAPFWRVPAEAREAPSMVPGPVTEE